MGLTSAESYRSLDYIELARATFNWTACFKTCWLSWCHKNPTIPFSKDLERLSEMDRGLVRGARRTSWMKNRCQSGLNGVVLVALGYSHDSIGRISEARNAFMARPLPLPL